MHCYCFNRATKAGLDGMNVAFDEFFKTNDKGVKYKDETKYCKEWFKNYATQRFMIIGSGVVVVIINVIATTILTTIVSVEKCHTINDETMG